MVDNLFYSTEGNFENFFDLLLKGFLSFLNFFFQAEREGEKGRLLGKLGMKKEEKSIRRSEYRSCAWKV